MLEPRLVRDEGWHRAARQARLLSWVSLAWMAAEGTIAVVAGLLAGSVALLAFGLDSFVEGFASLVIVWRFTGSRLLSHAAEERAQKLVAVQFFLLAQGYRVIPVRPAGCDEVLGVRCVTSLAEIQEPIDVVDVFRRPDATPAHAREAVEAGARALWLQLGITSPDAREIAESAGLDYVEDACTAVVHSLQVRGR